MNEQSENPWVPSERELEQARAVLAAVSVADWKTLAERVAVLDEIRDLPEGYGGWRGGQDLGGGVRQLPYAVLGPETTAVLEAVAALGISAPQRWMDWDEGRRIVRDPALVAAAEPVICALLIGTLRRNDRFSEGALLGAFESGLMRHLLDGVLRATPTHPA